MESASFPLPQANGQFFQEWISELQIGSRIKNAGWRKGVLGFQSLCKLTAEEWEGLRSSISQSQSLQNAESCLREFLARIGIKSDVNETASLLLQDLRLKILDYRASTSIQNYPEYLYEIPKIQL